MMFLSPFLLYGLGSLAVPILIHLWNRRKVVRIQFSTLRFLKLAAAKTVRRSRIENLFLLLLRCLVFALLILAIARPVIPKKQIGLFGGDVSRTVILALDHSLSMECQVAGKSRLETSKTLALAVLDALKPGDSVAVVAVNDHVDPVLPEPTVDHAVARKAIQGVQATQHRSQFAPLFRESVRMVAHEKRDVRQLYLFTENQPSSWQMDGASVFDSAWKESGLHLMVVRPDEAVPANVAIISLHLKNDFLTPGMPVNGTAVVQNFSHQTVPELFEIKLDGATVFQKPLDLPPEGSVEVPIEFNAPSAFHGTYVEGIASLEQDCLPGDDTFYFSLQTLQAPSVLLVEGQQSGPARLHSAYYLGKALTAGREASVNPPETIGAGLLATTPLERFSSVFLLDPSVLELRDQDALDRYVKGGGTVVVVPGDLADLASLAAVPWVPARPEQVVDVPARRLATNIETPLDPLFANTWDSETPFPALPQHRMIQWKERAGAIVHARFSNGIPFLISGRRGAGRVLILNASADRSWGDFPLSPAFLPLVQQICRVAAEPGRNGSAISPGDLIPVPPASTFGDLSGIKPPDGAVIPIFTPGEKSPRTIRAEQSGIYRLINRRGEVTSLFPVNVDRSESALKSIDVESLRKIAPVETVIAGAASLKEAMADEGGMAPLWPIILLLALLAVCLEGWIANRLANARAKGNAPIRIGVPFFTSRQAGASLKSTLMKESQQ